MQNKVCVVLSSYNGENFIEEQIQSILCQENVDVTIYIRDDGSSDRTVSIVKKLVNIHDNIILEQGKNVGFNKSFWLGVKEAFNKFPECEIFAFADQDDVWDKDKLDLAIKNMNPSSDIPEMSYSNLLICDGQLNPIGPMFRDGVVNSTYRQALSQIFCYGCTCVFNRKCAELYIRRFYYFPHDCWLFYIGMFCGKTFYDDVSHINYRRHGKNFGSQGKKLSFEKNGLFIKFIDMMKNLRNTKPFISDMTIALLADYSDYLKSDSIDYLTTVARYRYSIKNKCKMIFTPYIRTNSFAKNASIRIYLLFNKW